jgi:hypothetical protein
MNGLKKYFLTVVLMFVLIHLLLSGCFEPEVSDQLKGLGYVNTDYKQDFGFDPPENWIKDENDPTDLVRFYGPTIDDFTINLGINEPGALGSGETLSSLIQDIEENYPKIFTNFSMLSSNGTTINGMQSHEIICTYAMGVYDLKNKQVLIMKNDIVYVLTFTARQTSFDDYESIVDESISTFMVV